MSGDHRTERSRGGNEGGQTTGAGGGNPREIPPSNISEALQLIRESRVKRQPVTYLPFVERRDPDLVLTLEGVPQDAFSVLAPNDPLYPIAAWGFHHAKSGSFSTEARRAFFLALAAAWPPRPGRKQRYATRMLAAHFREFGFTNEEIADALGYSTERVRRLIREGQRLQELRDDVTPVVEDDPDWEAKTGERKQPLDPARDLSSLEDRIVVDRAESFELARTAARRLYKEDD